MATTVQETHNKETFLSMTTEQQVKQLLTMHNDDIEILKYLSDEEFNPLFIYLRGVNIPTKDKRLLKPKDAARIVNRKWWLTNNDKCDPYDVYYRNYINDVLSQVRCRKHNEVAYCHHFYHIKELLRFEPNLKVGLDKGIFKVWLWK